MILDLITFISNKQTNGHPWQYPRIITIIKFRVSKMSEEICTKWPSILGVKLSSYNRDIVTTQILLEFRFLPEICHIISENVCMIGTKPQRQSLRSLFLV